MPIFEVTAPDGRIVEVTAPEGATEQQAIQYAQDNWNELSSQPLKQQKPQPTSEEQVGLSSLSGLKNLAGSAIEPIMSMASGAVASPFSGLAGIAGGLFPGQEGQAANWATGVQNALTYEPKTKGGETALGAISYLPQKLSEGVNYAGEKTAELTGSPALGAAIATLPTALAARFGIKKSTAPEIVAKQEKLDAIKAENIDRNAIREAGQQHGLYAPAESGLKQTASDITNADRAISNKNAITATRAIAKKDLGLEKTRSLSPDNLDLMKEDAYKVYDKLVNESKLPQKYEVDSSIVDANGNPIKKMIAGKGLEVTDALRSSIKRQISDMEAELAQSPTVFKSNIESIKVLNEQLNNPLLDPQITLNQIKRLRNQAKKGFASDDMAMNETAATRLNLANDLEQVFTDNLEKYGKGNVVDEFRKAREKLAKLHTLENVVTDGGFVNLTKLAAIKDKYPLTGAMADIAKFAGEFRRAALPPTTKGSIGFMDIAKTTAYATAGHGMIGLGELAGRGGIPMIAERGLLQTKTPSYKVGNAVRIKGAIPYGSIAASIQNTDKKGMLE